MGNRTILAVQDALAAAITSAISGYTPADPTVVPEVVSITPMDLEGAMRRGRCRPLGIYITMTGATYDVVTAGTTPAHDRSYTMDVSVVDIARDGVARSERDVLALFDTIVGALTNELLFTTEYSSSPLRPLRDVFKDHPSGFVSATVTFETTIQHVGS